MNIKQLYKTFLECGSVSTDSRKGCGIFFGLQGDNFDGSLFGNDAIKNGAVCAITENALQTLQELATYHRKQLNIPIVGLTGTNGKTTTKELIVKVLQTKYNVGATQGNFNNHIGVPLTLLTFNKDTQIGIVEMGANHAREITDLCQIAEPNLGLITNVGYAHLEGFGSFEGVKRTKGELYDFLLTNNGVALYNTNDENLCEMINHRGDLKTVAYQTPFENIGDTNGSLSFDFNGKKHVTKLVGTYNIYNIAAAMAIGNEFKIDAQIALDAICQYTPNNNRSQIINTSKNKVFMDAYNANPSSMNEAIKNFAQVNTTNKIVILGDMKELGKYSLEQHKNIVELTNSMKFDAVFFVGEEFGKVTKAYQSLDEIIPLLSNIDNTNILIKGSRCMKLENLLHYL